MKVLLYDRLDPAGIPNFEKTRNALEAGDFRSADVKKVGPNLYRARLDIRDRLLFSLHRHEDEVFVLVLEHIANHAYDRSRFLRRGVTIDEGKLPTLERSDTTAAEPIAYVNRSVPTFHVLDKAISFDDDQETVFAARPPLVVIGSAGSGKTALTLEKMKQAHGEVLYVTRSPFLVRNSRDQYYALGYEDDDQDVAFLSFAEYLASLRVPEGREVQFRDFARWFAGHRVASGLDDANQVFEEFQGVLSGAATGAAYLSLAEYLDLGVKQSIFPADERERVHRLFVKYLAFLREHDLYDPNLVSFAYRDLVEPRYDFIVVDEVQDMTAIQLDLVLRSLARPGQFILCGDANQIVHPNFFSWSKLKSYFRTAPDHVGGGGPIEILSNNYRNAVQVTELANRILTLKTARFGSIDRESHYLVRSTTDRAGAILLLRDDDTVTAELNRKTRLSARYAVIVLDAAHKAEARRRFDTPLVFSVQEAKGLEYDNVVLYNVASASGDRLDEIVRGVERDDVAASEMLYGRGKDKSDRSLEILKFHINALYVAITRAIDSVYLIERDADHRLFDLLGLRPLEGGIELAEEDSSLETWRREARRLELQGKTEQAQQIRDEILGIRPVPWEVLEGDRLAALVDRALTAGDKRAKLQLFEYALVYHDGAMLNALARQGFKPAMQPEKGLKPLHQKYFFAYDVRRPDHMLREVESFGVDHRNTFNQTPLMIAARFGNVDHVERLVDMGADTQSVNNAGLNAFQVALEQACSNPDFAATKLGAIYERLAPPDIVVRSQGRLVKLDKRTMEFLLLNLMIAMFSSHLGDRVARGQFGFVSGDVVAALEPFPESLVPRRRTVRAYVSSVLAKNEIDRDDRYNRRLFRRLGHGQYVIDPDLALRVGDEWRPIYDLLPLDALGYRQEGPDDPFVRYADDIAQRALGRFREIITSATPLSSADGRLTAPEERVTTGVARNRRGATEGPPTPKVRQESLFDRDVTEG